MSVQRKLSILFAVLTCSVSTAQEHIENLKSALRFAEQLAEEGNYDRAESAYSLQLVLHSTPIDRSKLEGNELYLICDSLFASIPYKLVEEPIVGITYCDNASLNNWFGGTSDRVPTILDTGNLLWPEDVPNVRGYVDFVFDVDAEGIPVNIQAVFRTDERLVAPAVQWLGQVKYAPGRFGGVFSRYEHMRLRAEFGLGEDDS